MADVLTIRAAVARAKEEGLPVSEYTLRGWIKAGRVPVVYAGTRALVYYPNIVKYLQTGDSIQPPPVAAEYKLQRIKGAYANTAT